MLGLDEAIDRANAALDIGADMVFVEATQSVDEAAAVPKRVKGPCLLNMVVGGMTPVQDTHQAADLGYRIAVLPGILLATTTVASAKTLADLRKTGKPLSPPEGTGPESVFAAMGAA